MVLIFEIHKDFVHERLCKFTPEIEANLNLSFLFIYVWVIVRIKVGLLKAKKEKVCASCS